MLRFREDQRIEGRDTRLLKDIRELLYIIARTSVSNPLGSDAKLLARFEERCMVPDRP